MYYYLLSQLFHWDENAQKNDPNYPHAKKNILIFMIGSVLYLFTAGFLWSKIYAPLIDSILFLSIIKDFFQWFIFVDIFGCCILFKNFWGWGILSEVDGAFSTKNKPSNISNQNKKENIIKTNHNIFNNFKSVDLIKTMDISNTDIVTANTTIDNMSSIHTLCDNTTK